MAGRNNRRAYLIPMLFKIPLLAFLVFGVTYPLFFWLTAKDPIKHNFHRFHLACPVVIAGMAIIGLWFLPVPQVLKNAGLIQGNVEGPRTCYCLNKEVLERFRQMVDKLTL